MIDKKDNIVDDIVLERVYEFLKLKPPILFSSTTLEGCIKECCSTKLCRLVGLRCNCNIHNDFFEVFSRLVGEVVCDRLHLNLHLAGENLRFVKYEHLNFVKAVSLLMQNECVDDAILDTFNLLDSHRNLIPKLIAN
ncbi:MAG: hypothetical protein E7351_03785 [Clostridiales bacterium]|nr:hypothetical protein [Clostridiales bacterium]